MVLQRISLSGTPFERGVTHGEQLRGSIENNIEVYEEKFAENGLDEATIRDECSTYIDIIEGENEAYVREMEGVAKGSGFSLEEITMLNVRYELYYSTLDTESEGEPEVPDGCTSFAANPSATANGTTIVGQNWDWKKAIDVYAREVRRQEKPDVVGISEAGIVASRKGLNEHGIGFVTNGLTTPDDGSDPYRKPYHLRCREILDAERPGKAVEAVIGEDRVCSANFIIGHPTGEIVSIETSPTEANYIYPEDGYITHANHFEIRSGVTSTFEKEIPHTVLRKGRMERKLAEQNGEIDVAFLQETLRDHFNWPSSICSHPDPELDEADREHSQTLSSMIFDLTNRTMHVTEGPPCQTEYRTFSVD